jgi:hypothetical protein
MLGPGGARRQDGNMTDRIRAAQPLRWLPVPVIAVVYLAVAPVMGSQALEVLFTALVATHLGFYGLGAWTSLARTRPWPYLAVQSVLLVVISILAGDWIVGAALCGAWMLAALTLLRQGRPMAVALTGYLLLLIVTVDRLAVQRGADDPSLGFVPLLLGIGAVGVLVRQRWRALGHGDRIGASPGQAEEGRDVPAAAPHNGWLEGRWRARSLFGRLFLSYFAATLATALVTTYVARFEGPFRALSGSPLVTWFAHMGTNEANSSLLFVVLASVVGTLTGLLVSRNLTGRLPGDRAAPPGGCRGVGSPDARGPHHADPGAPARRPRRPGAARRAA